MTSATAAQQSSFISTYMPYAHAVAQQTGDSAKEIIGQWAVETGWGTNLRGNNPGNVESGGQIASYPTLGDGVSAYMAVLQHDNATNDALNPVAFADTLQNADYAGNDPTYAQSVLNTYASIPGASPSGISMPGIGQTANSILTNGSASNITASGCPSFAVTDPIPWMTCEAYNIVLIFFGIVLLVLIMAAQIKNGFGASTSNMVMTALMA